MARKGLIEKNKNRLALVEKYAEKRKVLKSQIMDKTLSLGERFKASCALSGLPRYSAQTALVNRCVLTGRARGVYRKRFNGICRHEFRRLALIGAIPGVMKA